MAVRAQYIYATNGDLIKQYNGLNAGGEFGYSVAAIGDQDGDLKEDVLIGERVGRVRSRMCRESNGCKVKYPALKM